MESTQWYSPLISLFQIFQYVFIDDLRRATSDCISRVRPPVVPFSVSNIVISRDVPVSRSDFLVGQTEVKVFVEFLKKLRITVVS